MRPHPPSYDLASPAFLANPYPTWAQMRIEAPVYQDADGAWHLTRYADCVAALHTPSLSSDRTDSQLNVLAPAERERAATYATMRRAMMLFADPPHHTRLRRLVARAFTPRTAEALRPRVQAIVDDLLAAAPTDDFDALRDLALPLPYSVIADLIGVPAEDRAQIKAWSTDFVVSLNRFDREIAERAAASLRAFADELRPVVARLRAAPEPNLLSALVAAEEQGDRLSEDELFATAMLLIIAGHETTTNLIGNGLWLLLSHPEQLALLRDSPALIAGAVEETLRYASPVQGMVRVASEEVTIGGTAIARGERVNVLFGAANRDPAHFAKPERFDITRQPNPHLGFGDYIHVCLGAALARVEGQVALGTLVRCYLTIQPTASTPDWLPYTAFRGLQTLPLRLRSRASPAV